MPYSTQAQVERAAGGTQNLIALTDLENAGAIDAAVLLDAQAQADSVIDGFLAERYSVPLASPPENIQRLAAEETVFILRERRQMVGESDVRAAERRETMLRDLATGTRRLEGRDEGSEQVARVINTTTTGPSRKALKGYA
jgi:phage gp36-like protein